MSRRKKAAEEPPPVWATAPPPPAKGPASSTLFTGALVLTAPAVWLLLQDNLTVSGAAVRFLGALVVSWLAVTVLRAAVRVPEPAEDGPSSTDDAPALDVAELSAERRADEPAEGQPTAG